MLAKIKDDFINQRVHIIIFNNAGTCLKSDGQLLSDNNLKGNLYHNFSFLESNKELLELMQLNDSFDFPCMNIQLGDEMAYCDFKIKKIYYGDKEENLWLIHEQTEMYQRIMQLQQERNENAISGEFYAIEQRALNAERNLLKYKNEELKRQQAFKTQFYAKLSHELRTPLHSIAGLSTLLAEHPTPLKQAQYLKALQATSRHLAAVVNNVIDFSRMEAGQMNWEPKATVLKDLIEEVCASFKHITDKKEVDFLVKFNRNCPLEAMLDTTKLKQVLFNLIGNAVKFTNEGSIHLEVSLEEDFLQLSIQDTGIGVPIEKEKELFKPYSQLANSTEIAGSGLGLNIVKQLCELSGGRISFERPENGKGSIFKVLLPYLKVNKKESVVEEQLNANVGIQSILIVDDDEINCQVLVSHFRKYNIVAEAVSTGEQALERLTTKSFDLIILDYFMPKMNGLETIKEIILKKLHRDKPIFMLTGDTTQTLKEKILEAGVAKLISKPVQPEGIMSLITSQSQSSEVNLDYLYKIADNNSALVKQLIKKFLDTVPNDFILIKQYFNRKEAISLQKMFHKTKINMKYVGMEKAFEIMESNERSLASGNIPVNLNREIVELDKAIQEAVLTLKEKYKSL